MAENVNTSVVSKVAQSSEKMVHFLKVAADKVIPSINKSNKNFELIFEEMNETKSDIQVLKRELNSCKESVVKAAIYADRYIQDVEDCIGYAHLDEQEASEMKEGYRRFLSKKTTEVNNNVDRTLRSLLLVVIILSLLLLGIYSIKLALIVGGCIILISTTIMLQCYSKHKQDSEEPTLERLKTYLNRLSKYHQESVESYSAFNKDLSTAKTDCEEALKMCGTVMTAIDDGKVRATTEGTTTSTRAGLVTFVAVLPFGGPAVAVVVGSIVAGAFGTATYKLRKNYEKMSDRLQDISKNIEQLSQIACECGVNMQQMNVSLDSLDCGRADISDHVETEDEYHSFCRNLDMMLHKVKNTQRALDDNQTKQQIQSAIDRLKMISY